MVDEKLSRGVGKHVCRTRVLGGLKSKGRPGQSTLDLFHNNMSMPSTSSL